jgi:uncharacterized membrane protein
MDWYLIIKTLHILSSTILFGGGITIAFFMFSSFFSHNLQEKYYAVRRTVLADMIFTTPAVIIQPISGFALMSMAGYEWNDFWLMMSYGLFILAGICWLPVVWIQVRMRNILAESIQNNQELPLLYNRLFKVWFILGWPAFIGLVAIFYLMAAKPV